MQPRSELLDAPALLQCLVQLPAGHLRQKGLCRLHGGARGSGERNGQYRHGERTKGAIAEGRKFSALLKMLRAGLM
jgi:hypothetical protein